MQSVSAPGLQLTFSSQISLNSCMIYFLGHQPVYLATLIMSDHVICGHNEISKEEQTNLLLWVRLNHRHFSCVRAANPARGLILPYHAQDVGWFAHTYRLQLARCKRRKPPDVRGMSHLICLILRVTCAEQTWTHTCNGCAVTVCIIISNCLPPLALPSMLKPHPMGHVKDSAAAPDNSCVQWNTWEVV